MYVKGGHKCNHRDHSAGGDELYTRRMDRDLPLKSEPFYSVQWEPNEYRKDPEEIVGSES